MVFCSGIFRASLCRGVEFLCLEWQGRSGKWPAEVPESRRLLKDPDPIVIKSGMRGEHMFIAGAGIPSESIRGYSYDMFPVRDVHFG